MVDLHVHPPAFLPQPFRTAWRAVTTGAPAETGFEALFAAGVDAVVAEAVGDPVVTRCFVGRSPAAAVEAQLAGIERRAAQAGARVVTTVEELAQARTERVPAVLLGVEGGDALGTDVDAVDAWHARGVRMVVLVHLGDNALGTTSMPWHRYVAPVPRRSSATPGLSTLGRRVVERMNRLGVVVDVAHCDQVTVLDVVDVASAPVVASHSGARVRQPGFARYLSDQELVAIAATGGVVGLWPFRARGVGVRDLPDLIGHARHIADTIGPEHLALGTDLNGVPGVMAGYRGPTDLPTISDALLAAGFTTTEVQGVLGANAIRVLGEVERQAHAS